MKINKFKIMPKNVKPKMKTLVSVKMLEQNLFDQHIIDEEGLTEYYKQAGATTDSAKIITIIDMLSKNLKKAHKKFIIKSFESDAKGITIDFLQAKSDLDDKHISKITKLFYIYSAIMIILNLLLIWL